MKDCPFGLASKPAGCRERRRKAFRDQKPLQKIPCENCLPGIEHERAAAFVDTEDGERTCPRCYERKSRGAIVCQRCRTEMGRQGSRSEEIRP